MSQRLRALTSVGAFFCFVSMISCGSKATAPSTPTVTITSVAVTAASAFTGIGQQIQFTATATKSDGSTDNVSGSASWQSSNTSVLTVSATGVATSAAEGDARITATVQTLSGAAEVSVRIQWILKGRLVSTADGAPLINGASVTLEGAHSISLASDGSYTFSGPGAPASRSLIIGATGFLTRSTAVAISGTRTLDIDLISLASPFSLAFYRELLRGSADNNGLLQQSFRWEQNPNFYINTRNGSSDMPPGVVADLVATIPALVTQVSNGRLTSQRIETGTETRPTVPGWINIEYTTAIGSCGLGAVGGNLARINPICSDLTFVGLHEVTHVLGFWHHTQPGGLMSRVGPDTRLRALSAIEAFHTKIAFARPRGNRDPDTDPSGSQLLSARGDHPLLACGVVR
jgi:hypothetical protein